MFLQNISRKRFTPYWKEVNNITYYFLSENNLSPIEKDIYEQKFIKYDGKNKKYPSDNII